jgi:hypothetical protein
MGRGGTGVDDRGAMAGAVMEKTSPPALVVALAKVGAEILRGFTGLGGSATFSRLCVPVVHPY